MDTPLLQNQHVLIFLKKLALVLVILTIIISLNLTYIYDIIESRILARLQEGYSSVAYFEPKDAAFLTFAFDYPEVLVFGQGTGGIDFMLIPYVRDTFLMKSSSLTPTYFLTRILGDVGMVGLSLIALLFSYWYKVIKSSKIFATMFILFLVPLTLNSMVGLPVFLLMISSAVAYQQMAAKNIDTWA